MYKVIQMKVKIQKTKFPTFSPVLYSHSLSLSALYTKKHPKTVKEATSGPIYLLMFFPLSYNGNSRIKEVVNNSRSREWTH